MGFASPWDLVALALLAPFWLRGTEAFLETRPTSCLKGTRCVSCHSHEVYSGSATTTSTVEGHGPHVCILGGGFGGLNTALALADLPWPKDCQPRITLVDQKERFVFLPLLYELCVGDASIEEVAPTFSSLLAGTRQFVEFRQRQVMGIDAEKKVVHTQKPNGEGFRETIPYDALVVATGAEVDVKSIPGVAEYALPFYTVEQCLDLRRRFEELEANKEDDAPLQVVVVGGGYSGVELALNTKQRLEGAAVTLVHRGSDVLQYATDYNRKIGNERLDSAGIEVRTNTSVVQVTGVDSDGKKCVIHLLEDDYVESAVAADLLLWTAGAMKTNNKRGILNSILPRDKKGRIVTGRLLRVKDQAHVFAVGDCSRARQIPYAATAQVAIQQAPVAAWNVYVTLLKERPGETRDANLQLLGFEYLNLGEMLTLGSDDASISSLGGIVEWSGPVASVLRRLIYAARMPTVNQVGVAALESTTRRLLQGRLSNKKPVEWR